MPEIDHDAAAKIIINSRVQARYDELRAAGKHGHYETMFRVVHEQRADAVAALASEAKRLAEALDDIEKDAEYGSVRDALFEQIMRKARAALASYRERK